MHCIILAHILFTHKWYAWYYRNDEQEESISTVMKSKMLFCSQCHTLMFIELLTSCETYGYQSSDNWCFYLSVRCDYKLKWYNNTKHDNEKLYLKMYLLRFTCFYCFCAHVYHSFLDIERWQIHYNWNSCIDYSVTCVT